MRGVTLPVEPVFSLLRERFVIGWKNIIREQFVGRSHGYDLEDTAIGTTNGAGPHNIHTFVISPDGVVMHAMPGFWHPEDFASELRLGLEMLAIWQDASLTLDQKRARFKQAQLTAITKAAPGTLARARWQGFDAKNELKRVSQGHKRDTIMLDADGQPIKDAKGKLRLKSPFQIAHERIAARPFVPFADFDFHAWSDYGRTYYDNNKKVDGAGSKFLTGPLIAKQQRAAAALLGKVLSRDDRRRAQALNQRQRETRARLKAQQRALSRALR